MLILLAERLGIGFSVWIKEFFAAFLPCGLNLWGGASPKCAMTAEAGGRNVDQMRQPCCKEDGGRPSGGGLQDQPSNRPALRGDKLPGGERTGKRRA
jgi:hypothetical protein